MADKLIRLCLVADVSGEKWQAVIPSLIDSMAKAPLPQGTISLPLASPCMSVCIIIRQKAEGHQQLV